MSSNAVKLQQASCDDSLLYGYVADFSVTTCHQLHQQVDGYIYGMLMFPLSIKFSQLYNFFNQLLVIIDFYSFLFPYCYVLTDTSKQDCCVSGNVNQTCLW